MLKAHAATTMFTACWGGFVGIISIGRTTLNRQAGGGKVSGLVAALMCLAMLFGAGELIAYVPKAALGGLILYLGLNMLRQWLWQLRKSVSREELGQILLILVLVANYGYVVGFAAGVVISCAIFIITYSRIPLTNLSTDLALFSSSVVTEARIHVLTQGALAKMRIHHPGLATRFDQMVIRRLAAALTRTNRLIATLD